MWKTRVQSLGQEDPLAKEMATHSSTLAWKIPWMEECGKLQSKGSQRFRHDWATSPSLYRKDLHDPDNHNGVITYLEPDILECKVKWAFGSITRNKARGGDGIPVELFQILEVDAVNVLHSICQQIWKTQQWPQDWKRSVFIPIPKNVQTTTQLHSSHTLAK